MAEWVHFFNFAAASSGLVSALLGLLIATTAPYVESWERRFFFLLFALLAAYIACDLAGQAMQYFLESSYLWLAKTSVFLELLFSAAIMPAFTAYLLRCAGEDWHKSPLMGWALVIFAGYVAVLVAAQFTDAVYYFSLEQRCVLPGPYFAALAAPPLLLMVLNLVALTRRWPRLTHRQRLAFAICNALPLASELLQAVFFGMSILVVGTSAAALIMLGLILADQISMHVKQREEAALQRARVMSLQMRPHFIYNVLTSIYYLCAQDPARAQQVTLDFTEYLRANFAAIGHEGLVPFTTELEHARAYLAVEQARFEDSLAVEIDCPHTAFRLPPLTLQPLVENAVKHGADPELPPLHVRMSTREEPGFSVVAVEDTGPGFGGSLPEGYPTGALDNVRERLAACEATLSIDPREGGGTIATIRIKRQEQVEP